MRQNRGRNRKPRAKQGPNELQSRSPSEPTRRGVFEHRRFLYLISGIALAVVLASILMLTAPWLASEESNPLQVDEILARYDSEGAPGELNIHYPFDEAVFPPEIRPPTFVWEDSNNPSDAWLVRIRFSDGMDTISVESPTPYWTPSDSQWQTVQSRSVDGAAEVTVLGVCRAQHDRVLSSASISIQTSDDEVGAPIFYREVNLPFRDAVNEPSKIRWRFGEVASRETPPVVLEKLPVCGNCHSFSADGKTMGMDVDYANDKGSYAILPVDKEMVLEPSKIITWSDFKRQDGEDTFGLLSRVSPDGRYVVSTVKDGSVFLPRPDIAFSQLFFPIKGILAVYSRDDGTIHPLPGADDPQYVQSNGVWSPDGKWIVFARSKRYRMEGTGLLKPEECKVFTEGGEKFLFDLYRIPFNDGRGGDPEPLAGASQNGMSNYFPRYSPDGKWIVFCKAKSYMLLQPDSELYIIPSSGGEARRLRCNTNCMNSWHSFSPNGRWMVFSSKVFSPYTQLFLTHFDDAGHSSPPVLLRHFTTDGYAANIPEFVHADDRAIERIRERFVNDYSYVRQAQTNVQFEDLQLAEASCRKALALNPQNASATFRLGAVLVDLGRSSEAAECFRETIKLEPDLFEAHLALGIQSMNLNQNRAAIDALREAVRLRSQYAPARYYLGLALQRESDFEQALTQFERILEIDPDSAPALSQAAFVRATCPDKQLRDYAAAIRMAERACELTGHNDPEFLATLARVYLEVGRRADALATARRASEVARRHGREDFARRVERDFAD